MGRHKRKGLTMIPGSQPEPATVMAGEPAVRTLDQQLGAWLEANNAKLFARVVFDSEGRPPQFLISVVAR